MVSLAAVVRLWGLGSTPVLYFDSGVYLGEGAFLRSVAQRAAAALFAPGPPGPIERIARATQQGTDAHPPDIAKPAHAILLALSMLILGKTVLAGAIVSALAGIGTVAVTYALGMVGWGARVAIPAALVLAISGQHLVYSREPLVESDGMFFAALAALVYLRARGWRGLVTSGVLYGLAFACNNRLSYLPAVLMLAELANWCRLWALVRRGLLIGIGFIGPLALIEGGYLGVRLAARSVGARADFLDYVQQMAAFVRMNPPDRWRPDEWPTYLVDVALMDGLPVLGLVMLGIGAAAVAALRRRPPRRADLLLLGSLLVPLALYSVYSTGEVRMRHFSLALPWLMLAAGLGLERLTALASLALERRTGSGLLHRAASARRWQGPVLGCACVGLLLLAVPRLVALDSAPAGMPVVLRWMDGQPVASTNGPVMAYFVGEDRTNARLRAAFVNVPSDLNGLAGAYSLLVVDMQAYVFPGKLTDRYNRAAPRLAVSNGNDAWYLADLLEHYGVNWGGWDALLEMWGENRSAASQLRIYDLRDLLGP